MTDDIVPLLDPDDLGHSPASEPLSPPPTPPRHSHVHAHAASTTPPSSFDTRAFAREVATAVSTEVRNAFRESSADTGTMIRSIARPPRRGVLSWVVSGLLVFIVVVCFLILSTFFFNGVPTTNGDATKETMKEALNPVLKAHEETTQKLAEALVKAHEKLTEDLSAGLQTANEDLAKRISAEVRKGTAPLRVPTPTHLPPTSTPSPLPPEPPAPSILEGRKPIAEENTHTYALRGEEWSDWISAKGYRCKFESSSWDRTLDVEYVFDLEAGGTQSFAFTLDMKDKECIDPFVTEPSMPQNLPYRFRFKHRHGVNVKLTRCTGVM